MIAPMSLSNPILRSSTPSAPAAPAPAPQAEGPRELLDLSTIDTAAEAAQLPILEPAFQLSLAAAVVSSMLGGASERQEICVVNKFPGTCLDTLFTLNMKNEEAPLTVEGSFNGTPISGSASLGDTAKWSGNTGTNVEAIEVGPGLDDQSVRLAGTFGSVPADLSIAPIMNGEIFSGVRTSGQLGGYPYTCETLIADSRAFMDGGATTMTAKGSIGELEIDKNYTVTIGDRVLQIEGRGLNAGVEQDIFTALSI